MNSHHTVAIGTWEGDKQQSVEYNSSVETFDKSGNTYNTRVSGEIYLF